MNDKEIPFGRKFIALEVLNRAMKSGNRQLNKQLLTHASFLKTLDSLFQQCTGSMLKEMSSIEYSEFFSDCCSKDIPTKYHVCLLAEQTVELVFSLSMCCNVPGIWSMLVEMGLLSSLRNLYLYPSFK